MLLNSGVGEDLRVPWTARRSNQSILKEINPEYSLEGLMLKLQYSGHLMRRTESQEKYLTLGKTESRRGRQRRRWSDGVTDLMDTSLSKLGVGDGQGSLACCSPWGRKEPDTTEGLTRTQTHTPRAARTPAAYSGLRLPLWFCVLLFNFFLMCSVIFKIFVTFYMALLCDCSKSGSILPQPDLPRQTGNPLHCLLPSHEVENPMHLHSQTCSVTVWSLWKLYPQGSGITQKFQLGLSHSPPWNLVIINSGNISPFFDTFLPFVFPLFTDCLDVRCSISWESLSTLFFLLMFCF